MDGGFGHRLSEQVCAFSRLFWYLLSLNVSFLFLGLVAYPFVSWGTPTGTILLLDFIVNGTMIVLSGSLLMYCKYI